MIDKSSTVRANMGDNQMAVCFAIKTKQIDMRTADNEAHSLDGNDDKEPQAVCYSVDALSSNSMKSKNPHSGFHKTAVSKCLDTMCCDPSCNQGGVIVVQMGVVYAVEGNTVDRKSNKNGRG